ncbi:MAG TPA: hypothetical protein VNC40_00950 [Gaiellaceae bacterium]|nr:hypothetical protein [Gaiellaceae bacterium]
MASRRPETIAKREKEQARREKRERKQAKKDARALGELPATTEDAGELDEPAELPVTDAPAEQPAPEAP